MDPGHLVLVVDDEPDARELTAEYLALCGFRVIQAADGEEALRVVTLERPDVILMDLSLPGIDGVEATKRLKADPATSSIPVLIMTGMPEEVADRAGADGYLQKPCPPDTLVARLGKLLARTP
jgi:two-component system, cell cycle response regulator DivK